MSVKLNTKTMTAYGRKSGAIFSTVGKPADAAPAAKATTAAPDTSLGSIYKWFPWGPNNLFPQDIVKIVSTSPVTSRGLNHLVKKIYGRGLVPCYVEVDGEGNEKITPADDPIVKEFFKRNNMRRLLLETIVDYVWFGNAFPEIILNKKRDKIVEVYPKEASYCRWELIDEKTHRIENCFYSGKWASGNNTDMAKVKALDMYDPLTDIYDGNAYKYILDLSFPSPDKYYYQLATWDSARSSGWLDITLDVPKSIKAMLKNQRSWRWHVQIPYSHWENVFGKISPKPTAEEEVKIMNAEFEQMDEFLSGAENAGKTFYSHYAVDLNGKELPGWKITPLEDKFKSDQWLPTSAQGNSEILFALGLDPSEIGAGVPGGGTSGTSPGSGSDKREAFLISGATIQADRDAITEFLYITKNKNGWDERLEFKFLDSVLTTLDKGKGTEKVLS